MGDSNLTLSSIPIMNCSTHLISYPFNQYECYVIKMLHYSGLVLSLFSIFIFLPIRILLTKWCMQREWDRKYKKQQAERKMRQASLSGNQICSNISTPHQLPRLLQLSRLNTNKPLLAAIPSQPLSQSQSSSMFPTHSTSPSISHSVTKAVLVDESKYYAASTPPTSPNSPFTSISPLTSLSSPPTSPVPTQRPTSQRAAISQTRNARNSSSRTRTSPNTESGSPPPMPELIPSQSAAISYVLMLLMNVSIVCVCALYLFADQSIGFALGPNLFACCWSFFSVSVLMLNQFLFVGILRGGANRVSVCSKCLMCAQCGAGAAYSVLFLFLPRFHVVLFVGVIFVCGIGGLVIFHATCMMLLISISIPGSESFCRNLFQKRNLMFFGFSISVTCFSVSCLYSWMLSSGYMYTISFVWPGLFLSFAACSCVLMLSLSVQRFKQ